MKVTAIFGGPGTGKTTALADLYAKAVEKYGADKVAFVSYTRRQVNRGKSAAHKKVKVKGKKNEKELFKTLHSLSKTSYGNDDVRVFDRKQVSLMSEYLGQDMLSVARGIDFMKNVMTKNDAVGANRAGLDSMTFQKYRVFYDSVKKGKSERLGNAKVIDFADMLQNAVESRMKVDVKAAFVDEAQDLSPLQWRAVYTFFRDAEELYVAGDPNQALYGFAGAAVNYMLEMKCDETIVLDKSHRCSIPVMRMAEKVWNRMDAKAALPSDNGSDNGFAVFYPQCDIRRMFLNPILASVEKGYKVMVLANTHERLYAIKKAFGTKNWEFPCSFYSGRKKFRWKNGRAATLSTIHQAKGLEADYVLIDASCGRSAEKNEFGRRHERWQDYWRVIYTAITRAKRGVVVFEMSKNHLVGEPSCMEELYYAKFNYEKYERWVTQTPERRNKNEKKH